MIEELRDQEIRAGDVELIELSVPARAELLSLPRMTAAAVAANSGFDIEQVEDIRLAVEELCLAASSGRAAGRLRLRLRFHASTLEAVCAFESEDGGAEQVPRPPVASELTEQILEALVDEHGMDGGASGPCAWFRKHRLIARTE